jgi:hypothetical protein
MGAFRRHGAAAGALVSSPIGRRYLLLAIALLQNLPSALGVVSPDAGSNGLQFRRTLSALFDLADAAARLLHFFR